MTADAEAAAARRSLARDVNVAEEAVLRQSLALLVTERQLDRGAAVDHLMRDRAALYFAAKRLTRAVDADPHRQPRGWHDEDREATPA